MTTQPETTEKKTTARKAATPKHLGINQALAAFQAGMPSVTLDGKNPHFNSKFASLANMVSIITPNLQQQGLVYTTTSRVSDEGKMVIEAKLVHAESGEYLTAEFPVAQTDPQKVGSAMSYFRRYGLAALTGVVADGDDDGNAASAPAPKPLENVRQKVSQAKPNTTGVDALKVRIRDEFIGEKGIDKDLVNSTVSRFQKDGKSPLTGVKLYEAVIAELEKI